jgi:hypothetical protein
MRNSRLEMAMKTFVVACVVALALAVGGAIVLEHYQRSAETAYSTTGARV